MHTGLSRVSHAPSRRSHKQTDSHLSITPSQRRSQQHTDSSHSHRGAEYLAGPQRTLLGYSAQHNNTRRQRSQHTAQPTAVARGVSQHSLPWPAALAGTTAVRCPLLGCQMCVLSSLQAQFRLLFKLSFTPFSKSHVVAYNTGSASPPSAPLLSVRRDHTVSFPGVPVCGHIYSW